MKYLKIAFLLISGFLMSVSTWASDGVLDTTFNSPDGYVLWDGGAGYDRGRAIALQRDGKILVTGYMTRDTDDDLMVIRYNEDGSLDKGFGTNGAVIYDSGNGSDGGFAITVQSESKILVAGVISNGSDVDLIIMRLNSDGTLDPDFASNGMYVYDGGNGNDTASDILFLPSGKVLVCGSSSNGVDNDLLLMRLNDHGTLDRTFGAGGIVTFDGRNGDDFGARLTIQNDGGILVAGNIHNGSNYDIVVAKFNTNGILDTSFGTNGIAIYDGGDYDRGFGIDTNSNGDILVTGVRTKAGQEITDYDIPVICFDKEGNLDASFGNNGLAIYDVGLREQCYDLIVQNDDTILITGHSSESGGTSNWALVVVKFTQGGIADTTFGTNGAFRYNPSESTEWGYGLALQTDGSIVATGQAHNGIDDDVIILRLTNNPDDSNDMSSLVWSQTPLEVDPGIHQDPVFCGWNEPARSTEQTGLKRQWRMDADDFRCLGSVPITRIRWWGGYKAWTSSMPPQLQPEAWHIGFWANQIEGIAQDDTFPERLVWSLEIPAERIAFEPVGQVEFPQKLPETCFVYEVYLEPDEWFRQADFQSNYDIFWISITAIYAADVEQENMWGWSARPHLWGNGAVMPAIMGDWPTYDERLFPGRIYPIENSLLCGQNQGYDMCFELLTEQPWIKWDQPFTSLRDWPNSENQQSFAIDDGVGRLQFEHQVYDDWLCEQTNPVVAISWQGSYIGHEYDPCGCNSVEEPRQPDYFMLSIRLPMSVSAGDEIPGELVWEYPAYDYDEVLVGYNRNSESGLSEPVFRYTVKLPKEAWFQQGRPNQAYWLSVAAVYKEQLDEIQYPWGWTSCSHKFGSTALDYTDNSSVPEPLYDQTDEPVDMSFTLSTEP